MTKDELYARLKEIEAGMGRDFEASHIDADDAILQYVDDERITKLHSALAPWCA